jgi:putative molybdopterin biosynthesis protein
MEHLRKLEGFGQLRAISEPKRLHMLRLLIVAPMTITSLGRAFGKHPAWVRHHVKALEAAGLVGIVEERTTRNYTEKFYAASASAFELSMLIAAERDTDSLLGLASHDLAVELLVSGAVPGAHLAAAVTGSVDCLVGLRQGHVDVAGCHLADADDGDFNASFVRHILPDRDTVLVTVARRQQGLVTAPGNPLGLNALSDVAERGARFVNRNRGSGTRLWIDRELAREGIGHTELAGYGTEVSTHTDAAARVADGVADAAVGVAAAAERRGLGFVPLFSERYDLVFPLETYGTQAAERLRSVLGSRAFRRAVAGLRGYDASESGSERVLRVR